MRPDTGATNIGPALVAIQKIFGVKRRGASVLFILTQSKLSGNVNGLYGTVRNMRVAGTKVFSIGIGGNYDLAQVKNFAINDRNSYAALVPSQVGGSLMNMQFWCLRSKLPINSVLELAKKSEIDLFLDEVAPIISFINPPATSMIDAMSLPLKASCSCMMKIRPICDKDVDPKDNLGKKMRK